MVLEVAVGVEMEPAAGGGSGASRGGWKWSQPWGVAVEPAVGVEVEPAVGVAAEVYTFLHPGHSQCTSAHCNTCALGRLSMNVQMHKMRDHGTLSVQYFVCFFLLNLDAKHEMHA